MSEGLKDFYSRGDSTEDVMWDFISELGAKGKAAAYWVGRAKDERPLGSDAYWYDAKAQKHVSEDQPYPGPTQEKHIYLTMSDGAEIAISIYLPNGLKEAEKLPTLINQTCYGRVHKIIPPYDKMVSGAPYYVDYIVPLGYAYVMVDVRGTGASSGDRPANRTRRENDDAYEIIDWIVSQSWSDGKVATEGVSYMGVSSAMSLATGHPAIVAAMPQFAFTDLYDEFAYSGGVFCDRLIKMWSANVHQLINGLGETGEWFNDTLALGVLPVDADKDGAKLKSITSARGSLGDTYEMMKAAPFRDSELPGLKKLGLDHTHITASPSHYRDGIEQSGVAIYSMGGWYDGGFLRGTIARFQMHNNSDNKHKLIVGPWDHGVGQNISPWSSSRRPAASRVFEMLRFFDFHLKGIKTGVYDELPVHYFTMGEEKWKASSTWPPEESQPEKLYFSENNSLVRNAPENELDEDTYKVDFSASSGLYNRWHTICNLGDAENPAVPIEYPARRSQQKKLLSYTSAPLREGVEVTGHPLVNISMACTTSDCAVFVYLEDVGPEGDVVYVTEGVLRASRRKISPEPYPMTVPYHSHLQADSAEIQPDTIVALAIEMLPTSYLFKKGRSIRVNIAGADSETFERVPADGEVPVFTIKRNAVHASNVELPIVEHH